MQNEHEFIAKDDTIDESLNFNSTDDDVSSEDELVKLREMGYTPFTEVQKGMDDLIEQSSSLSSEVAAKIRLDDLNEESGNLIAETHMEIERACNDKPLIERVGNRLPSLLGRPLINMAQSNRYKSVRSQKVSDIADKHFNALNNKKDNLKDQMNALVELDEKLGQFNKLMHTQQLKIDNNLKMLSKFKSNKVKMEILQGKELLVQVMHQIHVTKDLKDQISMVLNAGQGAVMLINKVLPSLKSNFIDQLAISTALQNLRSLQESVAKTREMTLSIREITAKETSNALSDLSKTTITYTADEFKRIAKIDADKKKLGEQVSNMLIQRDKDINNQLVELKKMNEKEFLSVTHNPEMSKITYDGMTDKDVKKTEKLISQETSKGQE